MCLRFVSTHHDDGLDCARGRLFIYSIAQSTDALHACPVGRLHYMCIYRVGVIIIEQVLMCAAKIVQLYLTMKSN